MLRKLRELRDHLRTKLREAERKRHDAHPGPRRERLAGVVRRIRDHLARVVARIAGAKKPDWNGHVAVLGATGRRVVAKANQLGLVVTATIDGTHSSTSYHYQRRAIDFGVDWNNLPAGGATAAEIELQRWLAAEYPNALEIFGPDGFYIKNGQRYSGMFPGHGDHDHFAI